MNRAIIIRLVLLLAIAAMIAAMIYGIRQRDHRIADLEHDNAVAFKLCGVVMCVPCNKGESGPQCQARMGDR